MATQQVLFAETIAGMKKAFKRKAYESDSDSEIEKYGNRGQKLKRKARLSHRGQLVPADGIGSYNESVEYAGVRRSIIHRNQPLVDEEGYEIDSDDDEARIEEALAAAMELNPYANINLDSTSFVGLTPFSKLLIVYPDILAPLTASTDLPTHPTLSKPFTSQKLTDLAFQSSMMLRRENHSLWRVRHLWTSLCGDYTWAPCQMMLGPNDSDLFTDDHVAQHLLNLSKPRGQGNSGVSTPATVTAQARNDDAEATANSVDQSREIVPPTATSNQEADVPMIDVGSTDPKDNNDGNSAQSNGLSKTAAVNGDENYKAGNNEGAEKAQDSEKPGPALQPNNSVDEAHQELHVPEIPKSSALSEAPEDSFIHPMFLPPVGASPDRDLGLPEQEAEDVRRLLALFVQKQEEICRGVKKLHDGLYKAQRLRKNVLHWSKAEAHCGPNRDLSDGEDWYDKEEWGLTEDLKKGQDDEEEDTTATAKKTRNRK
ncbi:unnamed protein product [Clonostachys chloroleuca]|uniref:Transcriptional regulatory protein RXT2 N-terminal domain-containing protein n=1 Tax=Clonostachys chloroleuca TaxID=1926264 RepID=A0AA35Q6M7_9HYPO|nr:unnamed protein product [Clonostachys chloroleuca]